MSLRQTFRAHCVFAGRAKGVDFHHKMLGTPRNPFGWRILAREGRINRRRFVVLGGRQSSVKSCALFAQKAWTLWAVGGGKFPFLAELAFDIVRISHNLGTGLGRQHVVNKEHCLE